MRGSPHGEGWSWGSSGQPVLSYPLGRLQWRRASWSKLCVTFLGDLKALSTMNGLWDPAKHQREPSNTETPKALGGHSNSYELVASGGKVGGDKSLPGFMKINKLKVSEMKDVLAVRSRPLGFQSFTHNCVPGQLLPSPGSRIPSLKWNQQRK